MLVIKNFFLIFLLAFPTISYSKILPSDIIGKWDCVVPLTDDGVRVKEQLNIFPDNTFHGIRQQTVPLIVNLEDGSLFPISFNYKFETSGKWKLLKGKFVVYEYVPKNISTEHDPYIQKWLENPPEWITKAGADLKTADKLTQLTLSMPIEKPMNFDIRIQKDMMKLTAHASELCQRIKD